MDRFIGYFIFYKSYSAKYLKSNMDRFIVFDKSVNAVQ